MNKRTTATDADAERMKDPKNDDPVNDLQKGKTKTSIQKIKNIKIVKTTNKKKPKKKNKSFKLEI